MIEPFEAMHRHKYCQLQTFRRDGTAVDTPVWFALDGERLYVKTEDPSGKIKRIRREPRVRVAPCTATGTFLGEAVEARARILSSAEQKRAEETLRRRYGFGRRLFGWIVEPIFRLRGQREIYLEVVPAQARS
jgi:PPOX class probable F420-dependent enzyme